MAGRRTRGLVSAASTVLLVLGAGSAAGSAQGGAPDLTAVSPASFAAGATLTLTGSGFGTQSPGAAVEILGAHVTVPAALAQVVSWSADSITVTAPSADLWPGPAQIEVVSPSWDAPSDTLPVTVSPPGRAIDGAQAVWVGTTGNQGDLRLGWYDAAGTPGGPITVALPTATPSGATAFTAPAILASGAVTVDGAPAGADVGTGTVVWPNGSSTAAALLTITPPPAAGPLNGPVTVDVGAAEGLQAPGGVYPIAVQGGGGSADLTLDVAAGGLAGFDVTVPADIPAGSPFPVDIQAVSSAGAPLTSSDTVYLASEDGLVNFTGAQQAQAGPTTVQAALSGGSAEVIAVASVAGPTTITVTDAAGLSGSAQVQVASPAAGGLRLQVFPPFSGYAGATAVYAAADVDTLNRLSGVLLQGAGSAARAYGGWWPNDPGQGYEAQWSGVLTVVAPPVAPSPLPQPTLQFAFLNVAAKGGTATLQPVTGSGGSVNGSQIGASLATAAGGTGWVPPSVVTLTPGQYDLTVQAAEDRADGGSGDTLYYSEAFAPAAPAGPFAPSAGATWTPLRPVPPAAFTAQGLPSPALVVPIGAAQADDAGAPLALLQPAQIDSGRTLLPLRAVSELLGAAVTWDAATQGITVTGPGGAAALTVGSAQATVNGLAVTLDQPALLLPPGVTMVPLRFLGQALGWQVGWAAAASAAWLLPPLLPAVPLQP